MRTVCRFKVSEVSPGLNPNEERITLRAGYDKTGIKDQHFAKYTPSGEMTFLCGNPNVVGRFKVGDAYFVTLDKENEQ